MKDTIQKINKRNLYEIYQTISTSCQWRKTVEDLVMWSGETVEVSNSLVLKAYNEANTEQKKLIEKYFKIEKEIDICDKIQNFKDVLSIIGEKSWKVPYLKPSNNEEKSINAQAMLFKIAKAYNQGWVPNWKNTNEYKWFSYNNYSESSISVGFGGCWYALSRSSGLHYQKELLVKDAYKKFKSVFEDFWQV